MINSNYNYYSCVELIQNNPLFKHLDDQAISSLLACLTYKKWKKNTEFYHGDQTFYKFYIVLSGRIKMYQINPKSAREFTLSLLTKNDIFDVISLLDGEKHSMNFETMDETEVLYADREIIRHWIETHPEFNRTFLPYLAHRLRMLESNLTDSVLSDIPTRLARLILTNVDQDSQELKLINDLPQDELANMIGSTRAVVNRHIQNFKEAGLLKVHRNSTSILNLKSLLDKVSSKL